MTNSAVSPVTLTAGGDNSSTVFRYFNGRPSSTGTIGLTKIGLEH